MENTLIEGHCINYDMPRWGPLEDAVGYELACNFMWMERIRLSDGRDVEVYKHCDTRCYLHITPECEAFAYVADQHYRSLPLSTLIEAVYRDWHLLGATPQELTAAKKVVKAVRLRERQAKQRLATNSGSPQSAATPG